MTRTSRGFTIPLLALLALAGFGLRVYHLGAQGIWGDEAFSISLALKPLAAVVAPGADTHPPLYHAMLHFWLIAAGRAEFSARYPALIAGVLLIPALYVAGRRLVSRAVGLVSAGLGCVSPFLVYYSQEARMYTWATLLCVLSVYFAARLWDEAEKSPEPNLLQTAPWAAGYLLATLAAMYSHYYAFLVMGAEDMYALWLYRKRLAWLGRWIAGQVALLPGFLIWMIPHMSYLSGRAQSRTGALSLGTLADIVRETFTGFGVGWPAPAWLTPWAAPMLAAALAGLIVLARRGPNARRGPFVMLYLLLPVILAWLSGPVLFFFHPRYLLIALPAYLLMVAAGLAWIGAGRRWPVAGAALAVILAASGLALGGLYGDPAYDKSGYREMMAAIRAQSRPGDALFLLNPEQSALFDYYGDRSLPKLVFPLPGAFDDPKNQARLAKVAGDDQRIWLVMFGNARDWDPGGDLQKWLSGHAFRAWRSSLIDTEVELYVIGQVEPAPVEAVNFGGLVALEGYGVSARSLAAGDTLQIALEWRAGAKMDKDYTIFTHLIDGQGKVVGQFDGPPMGGAHPTSAWTPGEENVDRFGIQIDPATPSGSYWLEVGWYDLATLERLPVLDAVGGKIDDRALLVQIEVR